MVRTTRRVQNHFSVCWLIHTDRHWHVKTIPAFAITTGNDCNKYNRKDYKSVLETIRNPPLAEAQTALGTQKIRFVERGYLSHCRTSMRNCFSTKIFTEIGQSAASGQKRFFLNGGRPPCWILKICSFCHLALVDILFCFLVQNFAEIGQSVDELWPNKRFSRWRLPPSWISKISIFGHVTVMGFNICCSVPNFYQNRTIFHWYSNSVRPSVCLSVRLSVRNVPVLDENGLTYRHSYFTIR